MQISMALHYFVTWIGNWHPSCLFFEQNGDRHLFCVFGTTPVGHFSNGVMGIVSDACCSAQGTDVLLSWRALCEPFGKAHDRLCELVIHN